MRQMLWFENAKMNPRNFCLKLQVQATPKWSIIVDKRTADRRRDAVNVYVTLSKCKFEIVLFNLSFRESITYLRSQVIFTFLRDIKKWKSTWPWET